MSSKPDLFAQAEELNRQGKYQETMVLLRSITVQDPGHLRAFAALGKMAAAAGYWDEAWDCLRHINAHAQANSPDLVSLATSMNVSIYSRPISSVNVPRGYTEAVVLNKRESVDPQRDRMNAEKSLKLRVQRLDKNLLTNIFEVEFRGRQFHGSDPVPNDLIALPPLPRGVVRPDHLLNITTGTPMEVDATPDFIFKDPDAQRKWMRPITILVALMVIIIVGTGFVGFLWLGYKSWIYPNLTATIPDVSGSDPISATTALRSAGFSDIRSREVRDPTAAGTVVGTDPVAGAEVTHDGTIYMLVGTRLGPPGTTVPMPDVVGKTRSEAIDILQRADIFNVEVVGDPLLREAVIIQTEPSAGSQVRPNRPGDQGDLIRLILSG